jgi:hypothetical protein
MEDKKQIIEKIKKIMALSENNPNQNEAIAAALKAQKLMAKFHIGESELGKELTESKIDSMECVVGGKTQKWKLQLAVVLAKNFRCKIYLTNGNVTFYGYDEDVKICSEVFYSLYKIGVKLSDKLKREMRKENGTAKGIRNTFCMGFVAGIKSELEKQCTALMIVIPKEVNEEYDKMSMKMNFKNKSTAVKIGSDRNVYDKGYQSGKDAVKKREIEGGN